jgi:uncharacterized protein YbjT (DUF2867 family)
VKQVSYVSGSFVGALPDDAFPEHTSKVDAERMLRESGVPYVIFRPGFFMENLSKAAKAPCAVLFGRQRHPLRMVATRDFARQVSVALSRPFTNETLTVFGPEAVTMRDAFKRYLAVRGERKPILTIPIGVARAADAIFNRRRFAPTLEIFDALDRLGDCGDSARCDELLGPNETTIEDLFSKAS